MAELLDKYEDENLSQYTEFNFEEHIFKNPANVNLKQSMLETSH